MQLAEKTLESKRIFEGRLLSLRVDTVELPDGRVSTREVVEHKGAVAIVAMLDAETLIMVRQFRQPAGAVLLEIPAGTLDEGEDPIACARRELAEETGYTAEHFVEMFHSYLAPGYSTEVLHAFLAQDLRRGGVNRDFDEFMEIVPVKLQDALAMIDARQIVDAKSICGILLASRLLQAQCR